MCFLLTRLCFEQQEGYCACPHHITRTSQSNHLVGAAPAYALGFTLIS
jgi:hypothetical protein